MTVKITDLFAEFATKCPICLMGLPVLIDDTDNPNRALISLQPVAAYQCDTCGWTCAGYIKQDDWVKILDERWNMQSKTARASMRYNIGISIIENRLSAWEFYHERQMSA